MEYKTEMCELVSEFMPDVTLMDGNRVAEKQKVVLLGWEW